MNTKNTFTLGGQEDWSEDVFYEVIFDTAKQQPESREHDEQDSGVPG